MHGIFYFLICWILVVVKKITNLLVYHTSDYDKNVVHVVAYEKLTDYSENN